MKIIQFLNSIHIDEAWKILNDMDVFYTNEELIEKNGCNQPLNGTLSKETLALLKEFDECINPFMNKNILLNDLKNIDITATIELVPDNEEVFINLWFGANLKFRFRRYFEQKEYLLLFECEIERYGIIYKITHYISNLGDTISITNKSEKFKTHLSSEIEMDDLNLNYFLRNLINQIEEEFIQKITIKNFNKEEDMERFEDIKVYKRKK